MTDFQRYRRHHAERPRRNESRAPSGRWARPALWWAQAVEGKAAAEVAESGGLTPEVGRELEDAISLLVGFGHHERADRATLTLAAAGKANQKEGRQ
jgi:hypothetical protein